MRDGAASQNVLELAKLGGDIINRRIADRLRYRASRILADYGLYRKKADNLQLRVWQQVQRAVSPHQVADDHCLAWAASWATPPGLPKELRVRLRRYAALMFMRSGLSVKDAITAAKECTGPLLLEESGSLPHHGMLCAVLGALASRNLSEIASSVEVDAEMEKAVRVLYDRCVDLDPSATNAKSIRELADRHFPDCENGKILQRAADIMAEGEMLVVAIRAAMVQLKTERAPKRLVDHMLQLTNGEIRTVADSIKAPEFIRAVCRRLVLAIRRKGAEDVSTVDHEGDYRPCWLPDDAKSVQDVIPCAVLERTGSKTTAHTQHKELVVHERVKEALNTTVLPAYMYWCANPVP